ncbi:DEAD/DEAH box helicase family protein [Microbacterium sp. GXF0217]
MRIAISGTHGTGKSSLIADFHARHPAFAVHGDPHTGGGASVDSFVDQFQIAARRLQRMPSTADTIMERCPLDFLAYLEAWVALGRPGAAGQIDDLAEHAAAAMESVDLLVLLPLTPADGILIPESEDLELREETDAALLRLSDDADLVPDSARVIEIAGTRERRLALLEREAFPQSAP